MDNGIIYRSIFFILAVPLFFSLFYFSAKAVGTLNSKNKKILNFIPFLVILPNIYEAEGRKHLFKSYIVGLLLVILIFIMINYEI